MTRRVLDASAAAAWLLPDEAAPPGLEALAAAPLHAPWLFWAELRNILVVNERRGRLSPSASDAFLAAVEGLGVTLDASPSERDVLRLSRDFALSVYDALYLELALRLDAPLATLDAKLAEAARRSGGAVHG